MPKASRITVGALVFALLVCGSLVAQQSGLPEIERYRHNIQECDRVIANWHWEANLQRFLVLLVIVFGALITIFQALKRGWCKAATLALGACTTILTSVNAEVFSADYRVLQESAIDGNQLVDQLRGIVDDLARPNADVTGLNVRWLATMTQFTGLQKAVLKGTNKTTALRSWMETVYAQSKTPSWIARIPADNYNLYFAGIGEDRSIEVARQRSLEAAVAAGVDRLSARGGADRETLRQVLMSTAATDKSYFEFDKSKAGSRSYTLLRISNDIEHFSVPGTPSESKAVVVPAREKWTDTGVQVRKGDTISFTATGRVQWASGKFAAPDGSKKKLKPVLGQYPVSSMGAGGLIAKIGSGPAFAVGNAAKVVANESGRLFLGINDNVFSDNAGEFKVTLVWTSSGAAFVKQMN